MGGDEDGFPLLGQHPDEVLELHPRLGIEAGGGFIHDEHLRIVKQRATEAKALGHALRKLVGESLGKRDEVGEIHYLLDPLAAFLALVAQRAGIEIQILEHRHVLVVSEMIGHPADEFADLGGMMDDIDATDLRAAERGVVECREDAHRGGFPRTIRADEAADRAMRDFEGHAVDGLEITEVAVEVLDF